MIRAKRLAPFLNRAVLSTAVLLAGPAALASPVTYRLSVTAPPEVAVEVRLRGDLDGETRLRAPSGHSRLQVRGGQVSWDGPSTLVVRHRPESRLFLSYRIRPVGGDARGFSLDGGLFAVPEDRAADTTQIAWRRLPSGWIAATDLDGRPTRVADLHEAQGLVGGDVAMTTRRLSAGEIRIAARGVDASQLEPVADRLARLAAVEQTYWARPPAPVLILPGAGVDDPDLVALTAELRLARQVARNLGTTPPAGAPPWLVDGLTRFAADRILLRTGAATPAQIAARLDAAQTPAAQSRDGRGRILMLKWDEDIRRATQGKADLDDVLVRMRQHAGQFAPGRAPDLLTGLISAAWVTAGLDLRGDIARYAEGTAEIPLPERLFEGCLEARVTVQPGFDSGFDHAASFASRIAKDVRRRGPAWNSGLRNGMRLDAWTLSDGDMTREIQLTVRPANGRGRARILRYWPYGDRDVTTRRIHLGTGLTDAETEACPRKLAGE